MGNSQTAGLATYPAEAGNGFPNAADGVATSLTLLDAVFSPENNEAAWQRFLACYRPLIDAWCRRAGLHGADAEDVSAEVLCKLVTAQRAFVYDPQRCFRSWLKAVVANAVHDYWRRRERRPGDFASGHPDTLEQLATLATSRDLDSLTQELDERLARDLDAAQQVVDRVRQRVRPHTWQAYWLTAQENQRLGDVARRLGMTVGAVSQAKWKVGRLLRAEGAKQGGLTQV